MAPHSNTIHIPEDLLYELILPRLPFKCLCRLKAVSKACHAMITSNTRFSTLQSLSPSLASTGFVYTEKSGCLSFLSNQNAIGIPDPSLKFLVKSPEDAQLLSSTNGLVLFYLKGGVNSLCVCNPATMNTEIVPKTPERTFKEMGMGLAFNPRVVPSRFAIVVMPLCFYSHGDNVKYMFNVFRSETGKWNRSEQKVYTSGLFGVPVQPVYAQGLLYWCCRNYVLWYDPEKDYAGTIAMPFNNKAERPIRIEVSSINNEIFCTCLAVEVGLEVWKLTGGTEWGAEWERSYKLTMEKLIDVSPQNHNLGVPGNEVAINVSRDFVKSLTFDGQNIYMFLISKIWHRGKDLSMTIKCYDNHFRSEFEFESKRDLLCCNMITGKVINISSIIPTYSHWELHHYHNSLVMVPPIQSSNS